MLNIINSENYLKKKEVEGLLWSVAASFGYDEVGISAHDTNRYKSVARALEGMIKISGTARFCCSNTAEENARYALMLTGANTEAAYVEPIAAATEALIACGIEDFYIKIGSNTFVKGLCEVASEECEALFSAIAADDEEKTQEILSSGGKEEWRDVILNIHDITDEAFEEKADDMPKKAADALDLLTEIYKLLVIYGLEKFPILDPGLATEEDYADMYFEVCTEKLEKPVCKGGISKCGAVLAEFDLDAIASLRENEIHKEAKTVIYPEKNAIGIAYDVAYNLRVNGCMAEGYVGGGDFEEAEKYSKSIKAGCMIRVFADGKLLLKDFKDNSVTETTVDDFLGYYEDDEDEMCDCGHHHDECDCDHHDECDCGHHH